MGAVRYLAILLLSACLCLALSPDKRFSQYTHRIWTQAQGLPQDTVRAIAQTKDGYLWIGTDEGLASFDGYRFSVYTRNGGHLPSSSVTVLCSASDGTLWIGTTSGLVAYKAGKFETYSTSQGLPNPLVTAIEEGRNGALWVATGLYLSKFEGGKFTNFGPQVGPGIQGVRAVLPEKDGAVWAAGYGLVAHLQGDKLVPVAAPTGMEESIATGIMRDRAGHIVVSGTQGLFVQNGAGWQRFTAADGLPDTFVRTVTEDRSGNMWVGTNGGLARRRGDRFVKVSGEALRPHEWVWSIFEDREGSLWVGTNNGLHQFLDQKFTVYTTAEGLPSDQPTTVYEDTSRRLWIGFHDSGLGRLYAPETNSGQLEARFIPVKGMPSGEVFSIRETHSGDLLVGTRSGLTVIRNGVVVRTISSLDNVGRSNVFDAVDDAEGRIWAATNKGVLEIKGDRGVPTPIPGGMVLNDAVVVLCASRDGAMWAGTYASGLWWLKGKERRLYSIPDGLPSTQIRSIYEDEDGKIWVGTFNGGVALFQDGHFRRYSSEQGLPSDNISRIINDRLGNLWLATTRGIVQVNKLELLRLMEGKLKATVPNLYGVPDGLRSAQCAPGYPIATGGTRSSDGRLWFPTGFGVAVIDPKKVSKATEPASPQIIDLVVDGESKDLSSRIRLAPDVRRIQFRYTAVQLSAPESLHYRYRLENIDKDWVNADNRRVAEYNNLPYGWYKFRVSASSVPSGVFGTPTEISFYRQPRYYETVWFRWAMLALSGFLVWSVYQLRLRKVQRTFAIVLDERARIAREIHDTLAQGFVGISSQLDAVAMMLPGKPDIASRHLELARRMSQHSLTEARRSIVDLRTQALEGADLASAIRSTVKYMTVGTPIEIDLNVDGAIAPLPKIAEQQLLRITQEALANCIKHAAPSRVSICLSGNTKSVLLKISDNGKGFQPADVFLSTGGHFGLLGIRERAESIGGVFSLHSGIGKGTTIEVSLSLP